MDTVTQTVWHRRVIAAARRRPRHAAPSRPACRLGRCRHPLDGTHRVPLIADVAPLLLVLLGPVALVLLVPPPHRHLRPRSQGRHAYRAGTR